MAGRTRKELEELIGFFVNTLVLRTDLSGDPSFREVLRRAREATLGAYEHQDVPFEKLVAELQPERSFSHAPLFQVMFAVQNAGDGGGCALSGLTVSGAGAELASAKFDLSLVLAATAEGLRGGLNYSTDLFERGTIDRMVGHLERVLEQVVANADVRLSRMDLLGAVERARVLEEWNRTDAEYASSSCIHELFERQVERAPGAPAVVFGDEHLSYAELNARANRLAHDLRSRGVGPEVRVGLCLERGPEMVAAVLAVWKAGGAYVPLDPAYPRERLAYMLGDSAPAVVLTQRAVAQALAGVLDGLGGGVPVLELDGPAPAWASQPDTNPSRGGVTPEHPAYVIYTSGSTGRPKGVLVPHRGLANVAAAQQRVFGVGPDDRVLQFASFSFDAAAFELVMALASGAALCVAPRDELLPGPGLLALLRRHAVTTVTLPPSALAALPVEELPALRTITVAGEALPAELVERWGTRHRLWNLYGPTEATIWSTAAECADRARRPDIGAPIANVRAYVLDAALEPLPVGVPGELYVGGAGVARGYLGRQGLTAERWIPDPFGGEPGARLYRTGDRARWLADGRLDFIGRMDDQVKVRGFRIEPGEIEARLGEHTAVREAVVIVREDAPGDRRLAAYIVGEAETEALREHLRRTLPEYMVPSAFVYLDALPLTPNGKVDRKALPAPEYAAAADQYVAPRTPVEEVLAGMWAEVLRLERVGVTENFFELGGHSLLATRVVTRVREVFALEVPLRAFFEGPTVAELAGRVEEMRRAGLPVLPRVVPAGRTDGLPLSFAQERLWFIDQFEPGSAVYNIPMAWRLGGALEQAALEHALGEIVRRHDSLRTVFGEVDGAPVQVIAPFRGFVLPVEDLSGLGEAEREAAVRRRAGEEARRAFDLSAGPLFRAALLRVDAEDHVLLLSMHHIVSDGWSMGVFSRELSALYAAFRDGRESPLPSLPVQYADYAVWQREQLEGEVLDRQLSYWRARLAGAPELLELPADRPRPPVQTYRGASVPVELSLELLGRLQALGRGEGATLYMTLLSAFQVLLSKYSGIADIVVGSPIAGRTRKEVEELIGFFINTLVLRTDLSGDPCFRDVMRRVRGVTLGAYEHQDVPFERLVAELQPERSLSHSPLFQVMFTLQNDGGGPRALAGLRVGGVDAELQTAKFDLSLSLVATSRGLLGGLTYSTDLFEQGTIERMVRHLGRVLEQVAGDADVRLSRLNLLGGAERALVVEEWNRTAAQVPADRCIHQLFEAQAARTPDAVALRFEEDSLTYRELNARANRLAHHLRRLGVGPEVRVGVLMERSVEMVVALLAVLKAGGGYVPLDPGLPAERLAYMLEDSAVPLVLVQAALRDAVPARDGVAVLAVDVLAEEIAAESAENSESGAGPDSLAYVIYTSGSTGRPKGVMNQHRGVVNRLVWMQAQFGIGADDVVLQKTPFGFDVSVWEFFWPLQQGARLVMARPDGHRDPAYLRDVIEREGVTALHFVPSMLQPFIDAVEAGRCASLRHVVCSGEALPPVLVRRFYDRFAGPVELTNLYGPTEAAVDVSCWTCLRDEAADVVPIGRPVWNTSLYVLDAALQPVPVGVPGELNIGGVQVARGYLDRPGHTAERYIPDPFSAHPGARLYRTGDKSRWRAAGAIEYLGRLDFQVKVRGFRIELGEIESVLRGHGSVTDCVVVARAEAGETRLVAYIVGDTEVEALRAHVRRSLPEYMVPSAFVFLDALPLTPNGKLDRKALPAPELASTEERFVAPRTPMEEVLAGIWAQVLRLERVGVEDNFFELGGHSLLATRVVSHIREVFGVEVPLRALFAGPTVAELAVRIEEMRRADLPVLPPVVPVERTGALPLSFAQERLWFIDQLEPGSAVYNIPMAWRLGGALDRAALERALGEIVRRHEALRTTFGEVDGSPVQVIAPFSGFVLPAEDLSALGDADRETAVRRRADEEARRPFDLSAGPLFRALLLRMDAEDHALLLSMHHIVSDGWSTGVLRQELSALYAGFRDGRESQLPELPVQYGDYAVWQRKQLEGEVLDRQLAYWRERLAGAPELLELPADRPRPPMRTYEGATVPVNFSPELLERSQTLGRSEGATLYMTLLAAFQVLLSKYTGIEDIVVGSPIAGRTRGEVEALIGFFVNTLVLRTDLSGDPSFREVLRRVRETTLGAYEHQDVPVEKLVEELQPERSLSHSPLFQVMFTLQNAGDGNAGSSLPGLRVSGAGAELASAKFDLSLTLTPTSRGLRGGLTYSTDLFEPGTVERMARHLERVLEQIGADVDVRLSRLDLLGAAERAIVLEEWNRTVAEVPADRCIHELIEAQALRTPGAVAVRFEAESLTYGELNERANRLAHHLRRHGVGPEVRVGVLMERSLEMVVSLLAVLKAGGAYVPLDPGLPTERLAYMLEDSGVPLVLAQAALREAFPARESVAVLAVDALADEIAAESTRNLAEGAGPDSLAYVIYTSGSTGRPKGVMNQHRGVVNRLVWMQAQFGIGADDVVLQKTPFSFDVSVWEFFWPLQQGARLVKARPDGHRDPVYLRDVIEREGVTALHFVPSMLQPFVEAVEAGRCASLRHVVCSGEALPPTLVERFYDRFAGPVVLTNLYGPTEAAVDVSCWTCPREDSSGVVPIGRPVWNTSLYVLDAALQPVPVGVPGELFIGGVQVARGYLDRPGLTAERFIPDPFSADPGARLYRTGDRARWRADGAIEYLGRLDFQVKIRGFRIELGEIEAVLREHESVADCVVVARGDAGEQRLVAYVVGGAETDALREHLRQGLPDYMVPSAFVSLSHLPLTPSGKLDRKALPAPEYAAAADGYVAPRTPVEEVLAAVWAEVLRLERVGVHDNFFELGGHSLLATRMASRIRAEFSVELPLRTLFEGPTVAALAARVEEMRRLGGQLAPPVLRRSPASDPYDSISSLDELSDDELDLLLSNQS
ncbi:amino acid adenylation domain-containing protein [Longimicrobium sp.]|uniref:non-ribosomal peptide synthetase n=1 Tax=Longimicrobium sp. TaxID=2029185 RepID=UPI002F94C0CB